METAGPLYQLKICQPVDKATSTRTLIEVPIKCYLIKRFSATERFP